MQKNRFADYAEKTDLQIVQKKNRFTDYAEKDLQDMFESEKSSTARYLREAGFRLLKTKKIIY